MVISHLFRVTKEFVITLTLSFLPIIISSIVVTVFNSKGFFDSLYGNFSYGEAFIYTSAFLTPYLINRIREGAAEIGKELCFYIFLYSLIMGSIIFSLVRTKGELSIGTSFNDVFVGWMGLSIILATVFIWYYSVWPNHKRIISFNEANISQTNQLKKDFDSKVGGGK